MEYSLAQSLGSTASLNADQLALDLNFAGTKSLTASRGPTPSFSRGSTATFIGSDKLIQTAAINEPRFDHDPVTGTSKGLLIEEARTNLSLRSQELTVSPWSTTRGSISAISSTNPAGGGSSFRLVGNTENNSHLLQQSYSVVAGAVYTSSVFFKAGEVTQMALYSFIQAGSLNLSIFNLTGAGSVDSTGSGQFASIVAYPNGWYRCSITETASVTTARTSGIMLAKGGTVAFIGSASEGAELWGTQVEVGVFPSSYIPTTSTTVTRATDVCNVSGANFTSIYNRAECSVFASFSPFTIASPVSVCGTDDPRDIEMQMMGGGGIQGSTQIVGGGIQTTTRSGIAVGVGQKFAYAAQNGNFAAVLNGGAAGTASGTKIAGTPTLFHIGRAGFGGQYSGHISKMAVYKKRLANAKLQSLTT